MRVLFRYEENLEILSALTSDVGSLWYMTYTKQWLSDASKSADVSSTRARSFVAYKPPLRIVPEVEPAGQDHPQTFSNVIL